MDAAVLICKPAQFNSVKCFFIEAGIVPAGLYVELWSKIGCGLFHHNVCGFMLNSTWPVNVSKRQCTCQFTKIDHYVTNHKSERKSVPKGCGKVRFLVLVGVPAVKLLKC